MHIAILHLSDIHIRYASDRILDKAANIAAVVNAIPHQIDICIVAVSGDIAYSGKTQEYDLAKIFFEQLKTSLISVRNVRRYEIVLIPGNHDCDFSGEVDLRKYILKQITEEPNKPFDASIVGVCTAIQDGFFSFMSALEGRPPMTGVERLRYTRKILLANGAFLHFHCYNTAWVSRLHEIQGDLSFPLQTAKNVQAPGDISIAMFHHPTRWLRADNARQFEAHIEASSDFVIIGHEHVVGQFQKSRPSGQSSEYYEGGALHSGTLPFSSEFSVIIVDVANRQHSSVTYTWDSGRYERSAHTDAQVLALSPERYSGFKFTHKFEQELLDPGAQFTHPGKVQLTIDDVYIYPDLREFKATQERGGRVDVTRSKSLAKEFVKLGKVVVYGDDSSGKTSLARAWTRSLLEQDIVPIYVSASDFEFATVETVVEVVRARCVAQYGQAKWVAFEQLNALGKSIIIDDCHRSRWYRTQRQQMIDVLDKMFGTIVIFGDVLMRLNDITYTHGGDTPLLQFHKFDILPFGYELRHNLAEKWIRIGRDVGMDEHILTRRVNEAAQALNTVIGKDLVPSHPIYLLIILQQLEAVVSASSDTTAYTADGPAYSYGSYGYFYELLITRAFANAQAQEKGLDLDTGFKYLAELAHWMFTQRTRRLSREELRQQHESYCAEYRLSLEFDALIGFLVRSSILKRESDQFEFKYPYQYYYSVARALRDDSGRLGADLPELIRTVYTDESAGIIMFLVYLSRDERIISSMLDSARSLYADVKPCDMREDVSFLRTLPQEPTKLKLPPSSARENRLGLARDSDRLSAVSSFEANIVIDTSDEEGRRTLNDILQLNVAFKTVQILGQIIKNFPGSTKGSLKFDITRECYSLGLRAMNRLLRLIADNQGPLKIDIEKWLHGRGVNPTEVGGRAHGMIGWLSEALALTFILKTAEAVGFPKLAKTYDEIVKADASVGVRMIDLTVRLEHLPGFPENELNALRKLVHADPFPRSILTRIAYRHFYLYDTPYKLRQRVCASLDITVPTRRSQKELKGKGR